LGSLFKIHKELFPVNRMSKVNTIMIIDDDPDDRTIFHEAIKEVNPSIRFMVAASAEKALQSLVNTDEYLFPDLIFLDVNMPRMNGIECLVELKKEKRLACIPVVIYSTAMSPEHERQARAAGASQFLSKPLLFNEICKSIAFAIRETEKLLQ
jgi:CheY-like chemotaxis protein